jgi:hypothetical protein
MAIDKQKAAAKAHAAYPNVMNVNELKTLVSNPKADMLIFYGDHTKDSIIAKDQDCSSNLPLVRCIYSW